MVTPYYSDLQNCSLTIRCRTSFLGMSYTSAGYIVKCILSPINRVLELVDNLRLYQEYSILSQLICNSSTNMKKKKQFYYNGDYVLETGTKSPPMSRSHNHLSHIDFIFIQISVIDRLFYIIDTVGLIDIYLTPHHDTRLFYGGVGGASHRLEPKQGKGKIFCPCQHSPNGVPQVLNNELSPTKMVKARWDRPKAVELIFIRASHQAGFDTRSFL